MKKIISFWIVFLLTIVSAEAAKAPRKFYLTPIGVIGSQALTACADGYHMASLWEILDVSNLKYDTTLGITKDDSGSGPPGSLSDGWIRTSGESRSNTGLPGRDNCDAWTNDSNEASGTMVTLSRNWTAPASNIDPWVASVRSCAIQFPVWCVQD